MLFFYHERRARTIKNESYEEFVNKFKPKKTTDDCYTPPYIYDALLGWAVKEYGLQGRKIVRPFYPGGDYKHYMYPENCVVVDNPPFSILSQIIRFYVEKNLDFLLFAPALTLFSCCKEKTVNAIVVKANIIYENGAEVNTGFVTNMGEYKIYCCPELQDAINGAQRSWKAKNKKSYPQYRYPHNVVTAATIQKITYGGETLKIKAADCHFIRKLDAQQDVGKVLYGGGFLLSEEAAEKVAQAAERAKQRKWQKKDRGEEKRIEWQLEEKRIEWQLSDRELAIVAELGDDSPHSEE